LRVAMRMEEVPQTALPRFTLEVLDHRRVEVRITGSGHLFGVDLFGGIDVLVHEGQQPILVLARGVAHRELHCGSLFLVSPGRGCRGDRSRARGPRQSQWLGGGVGLNKNATFSSMLYPVPPVKGVNVPRPAIFATAAAPIGKADKGPST